MKQTPSGWEAFLFEILKSLSVKIGTATFLNLTYSGKSILHSSYLYVREILKRYIIFIKTASFPPQSAS